MATCPPTIPASSSLTGWPVIRPINAQHPQAGTFREALRRVTQYLAREMARDGEGATKLMTVHVRGARDKADAVKAARAITVSPLWQCALAGGDPNWGRIVGRVGRQRL